MVLIELKKYNKNLVGIIIGLLLGNSYLNKSKYYLNNKQSV